MPHHNPAPETPHRRVDYAVAQACLVGMLLSYVGIALANEATDHTLHIASVMLAGVACFRFLDGRVPARWLLRGALFGILGCAVATNFLFPVGGATVVFALTAAVLIFWEVPSGRLATASIAILFAVPVVAYVMGVGEAPGGTSPEWVTVAVAVAWTTVYAAITMERARGAYADAYARLSATESRIGEEVGLLRAHNLEQAAANERHAAEAAALAERLLDERAATQRLRDALGDRDHLTAAIRADLRAPLRSITSFSQLLRRRLTRDLPESRAGEYLAFAEDGGRRMAAMVDDLLRYTQADHVEALVSVPFAGVVAEVRLNLADQVRRTGATLSAGELPVLRGYPTQLLQLAQNIISNAIKFARPGVPPVVTVTAVDGGDGTARVTFADNGRGIPAHQLGEVFGLFNRSGNVGEVEGSGVGLALCRRIAIAHGGALTVASAAGEGTAFHFVCPVAVGEGGGPPRSATPTSATPTSATPVEKSPLVGQTSAAA